MKKFLTGLAGLVLLLLIAVVGLSWHPALADVEQAQQSSFSVEQINKGAILAGIGNCAACHTVKGGGEFAGGLAVVTPFGRIYSSNITPDPATGIGRWSQEAFKRALHEGVRQDGANLFPAFPYTYFAHIKDDDVAVLYAYFMTRPLIKSVSPKNTLPFPLNVRALQTVWKWLYFDKTPLLPDVTKSEEWNRGRYLAEGVAHCAACHTPRNSLGGERKNASYAGAAIDGWYSPALTSANPALVMWSETEIYAYLRYGKTQLHGVAIGPMAEVVHTGLAKATDADVHALATYFSDLNGATKIVQNALAINTIVAKVTAQSSQVSNLYSDHGAALYVAACASCHSNSAASMNLSRPELGFSSTLFAPNPDNFLQVILYGIGRKEGSSAMMMPGFDAALTNTDIVQMAAYLRRSRTTQPPWLNLENDIVAMRRAHQP
ncbi:c-type cytochrome [Undibacterium sp. RuRC25W]|uniref:c-type cytochrome n=1 Tax=Undibacterium sp. RuRC25W TaxID=3413047 RepID=UPI003BF3E7DE